MLQSRLSRLIAGCAAPALLVVSITAPACAVDEDFVNTENTFSCTVATQEADCIAGFVCDSATQLCKKKGAIENVCIDMDQDGYGAGPERTECPNVEEDFDDADPVRYPGAPEICDGKDNNNDMQVDGTITCSAPSDCPQVGFPDGALFRCTGGVCVLKPSNTTIAGCDVEIACNGAAGYAELPEQCK
jgi:hypothetical protein